MSAPGWLRLLCVLGIPWLALWMVVSVPLLFREGPGLPFVAVGLGGCVGPWIWLRAFYPDTVRARPYAGEPTAAAIDLEPHHWWPDIIATVLFVGGVAVDVSVLVNGRMDAATAVALTAVIILSALFVIVRSLLRLILGTART